MSTRSRIGLELSDGSVLSSYHHYDGYPEWLGKKLVENYNSLDSVSELIDGGDMSTCYDSDENPTPVYYTQRGESLESNAPRLDRNLAVYCDKEMGEEYHYVYMKVNGDYMWVCIDQHQWDGTDKQPEVVAIPA